MQETEKMQIRILEAEKMRIRIHEDEKIWIRILEDEKMRIHTGLDLDCLGVLPVHEHVQLQVGLLRELRPTLYKKNCLEHKKTWRNLTNKSV